MQASGVAGRLRFFWSPRKAVREKAASSGRLGAHTRGELCCCEKMLGHENPNVVVKHCRACRPSPFKHSTVRGLSGTSVFWDEVLASRASRGAKRGVLAHWVDYKRRGREPGTVPIKLLCCQSLLEVQD